MQLASDIENAHKNGVTMVFKAIQCAVPLNLCYKHATSSSIFVYSIFVLNYILAI